MFSSLPHVYLKSVPSTNTLAMEMLSAQLPHFERGVVIQTLSQTAGRGRQGRVWQEGHTPREGTLSPSEANLFMTLAFPQQETTADMASFHPFFWGIVLYETLAQTYPFLREGLGLKWPNDLVYGEKKLAGILVETTPCANGLGVIVGMGMNLNTVPVGLEDKALCVRELVSQSGRPFPLPEPFATARSVVRIASTLYPVLRENRAKLYEAWSCRAAFLDKPVRIRQQNHFVTGVMKGLAPDGALKVMDSEGCLRMFYMIDDLQV